MKSAVVNGLTRSLVGWKPDKPDARDLILKAPAPNLASASLRPDWKLAIRNQGGIGTCTANASLEAAGYLYVRDGKPDPVFARLFQYWVSRVKIEKVAASNDSGCQIRDVMLALQQYGACAESIWPYADDSTTFTKTPSDACFQQALTHKLNFFYRCPDLNTIKASIAQGFPVIFGFSVPENFMSDECAATGIIKVPTPAETFDGGHCMMIAAWDDGTKMVSGPNSWGEDWGDNGWFHMPYEMLEDGIVSDCWTARRISE